MSGAGRKHLQKTGRGCGKIWNLRFEKRKTNLITSITAVSQLYVVIEKEHSHCHAAENV